MKKKEIEIKIFYKLSEELKDKWLNFEKESGFHFFQKYEFIENFLHEQSRNCIFIILTFKDKTLAILPLEIKKTFGLKVLQWLGTKEFDYCGPLISNFEKEGIPKTLFRDVWKKIYLEHIKTDLILLDKQLEKINDFKNPFVDNFNNILASKIYSIKLPNDYQSFLKNIANKKFINEFTRTKGKLLSENKVEFCDIEAKDTNFGISDIIKQKARILDKRKKNHILDSKMISILNKFKERNSNLVKITTLKVNGELVAANLGLILKSRYYYYMPVLFSEKFNKYSPGKVLISHLIEWSIVNKIDFFDFGLGDENYKKYWSNLNENLFRYFEYTTFKGLVAYLFIKFYLLIKQFKLS